MNHWKVDVKRYFADSWKEREDNGVKFWQDDGFTYLVCQKEAILQLYPLSDKKVLIIGAGRGYEIKPFKRNNAWVVATDLLFTESMNDANESFEMDAEKLKFENNNFDIVYAQSVLMFTNKKKVLKEVYRVLKPEGKFVSIEPFAEGLWFKVLRKTLAKFHKYEHLSKNPPKYMVRDDIEDMNHIFGKPLYQEFRILTPFYHFFRILKLEKMLNLYFRMENALLEKIPTLKKQCLFGIHIFKK
jgi:SAM-dependent methyltransferase